MIRNYLDYAGLKRVIGKLFGIRRIWHGTAAEWEALTPAERDYYDQAEVIDAVVENPLLDIVNINSGIIAGKVLPSFNSGESEEIAYFVLPKKGTYLISWSLTVNGNYGLGSNHPVLRQPYYFHTPADNCTITGSAIVNCPSDNYRYSIKACGGNGDATYTIVSGVADGTAVLVH